MEVVAMLRGLHRRGPTYYSRIVVPTALVPKFGRREIWKSLKTAKRSQAEALHLKEAAHWAAAFAEAEQPANAGSALPRPAIRSAARKSRRWPSSSSRMQRHNSI
jgi:hypothetical protein